MPINSNSHERITITFLATLAYNCFFPGSAQQAGGYTRIYNLAKAFAKRSDYKVNCIVGDFGQSGQVYVDNVCLIKAPIDNPFKIFTVWKILKNTHSDIFIDFCASPRIFLLYFFKRFLKRKRVKYIFLSASDADVDGTYRKIGGSLFYHLYKTGLKNADAIISQTPKHRLLLKKNDALESYLILSPYLNIKYREPNKKEFILWVGRSAIYKNPQAFVEVAKYFPAYKFIMICNQSDKDNGFMNRVKKYSSTPPNLFFYEYIPFPQMSEYYKKAKILVNTSNFEGFPNTFIEAAIHNTPILSLNSDPNHMLSFHEAGICCNGDLNCLKSTLASLLKQEQRLQYLGMNAYKYAEKFHRLEDAVIKMDRIFREVAFNPLANSAH